MSHQQAGEAGKTSAQIAEEVSALPLADVRRGIRESRRRFQRMHGSACRCWLCRGN